MSGAREAVGTLDAALAHAERLLASDPRLAAEQAREILAVVPGHPAALLLLGTAWRNAGEAAAALEVLGPLAAAHSGWAIVHYELGLVLGMLQRGDEAVAALQRAVELAPDLADGWRALADHLTAIGDAESADAAYARHLKFSTRDPRLLEAATALVEERIAAAESLLRQHLREYPTDIAAIRMLAEVATRLGRYGDAERLLGRCLQLSPSFTAARYHYAVVLLREGKAEQALAEIDTALADEPSNPGYRNLKAAILARLGDYDEAIRLYREVLAAYPAQAKGWMSYGHALKAAGRTADSVAAYRRSIAITPSFGEAWWSLANLKTFRFTEDDTAVMRRQLDRPDLSVDDQFHFHFALGKALEDAGDFGGSFRNYEQANRIRRGTVHYKPAEMTELVDRSRALFTGTFFHEHAGTGCPAPDPIFIVGLPRAGSTLLEQILASHSAVEGTMELPDIAALAAELGGRKTRDQRSRYPEILATLSRDELRQLGERYLDQTRIQRKSDAPYFIDKMPNNFTHVGLIHLILPNARIIDARRHPLACCFSCFKQHFARGQHFTYCLEDIGRYYHDYVRLMAHFDAVLPGRVHRVNYEQVVEDTEGEVRRLLAYCGLPFEDACLRFYETERPVRTASSEQVRRPIYQQGVGHWRNYEPWLGPLKDALGPVLDAYPGVPAF
jgi:tetratricopeptide (TPR) repeat protein